MKTYLLLLASFAAYSEPLAVRLVSNLPSPQPVGSIIGLIPRVENATPGKYVYRYSVSSGSGPFHVVRDFSQQPEFAWTPELVEHQARVRMTVRNNETKETAEAELPFTVTSRIRNSRSVITPTAHPLVALFSAPACPEGSHFRVAFRRQGDPAITRTPAERCRSGLSNNVYVAGMQADRDYEMRSEVGQGSNESPGGWLVFHTGLLDGKFPKVSIQTAGKNSADEAVIVRSLVDPWRATATDLDGNVLWYLRSETPAFLTRMVPGGHFLVHADGANSLNDMKRWQVLRELNLPGGTLRETNIGRLAEQLGSRGIPSDCKKGGQQCVSGFHHEAIRLPNGHTLVLAGLERMFPAGTQESKEPVDVLGDLILDLDEDFQLAWVWNSFDHMDLKRASLGGEKCKGGPGDDGCTPVFLADAANGWLHSNSLFYSPVTHDLLMSIPEQDWIVRVDYKDGKGSGKVLWRLGEGGDFTTSSTDSYPWFSYQHDAGIDPKSKLLVLFDDGHRRKTKFPQANNRGQAWKLDEVAHTATLVLNADLGVYAVAVGSAQALSNGNYSFESGFINPGSSGMSSTFSRTIETSPEGKIVFAQQVDGALTYRSFRVANLYTAPGN